MGLKLIAQAGAKGITRNELTRKTQFIRRTLRDDYINDLVESNEIIEVQTKTGGILYLLKEYSQIA